MSRLQEIWWLIFCDGNKYQIIIYLIINYVSLMDVTQSNDIMNFITLMTYYLHIFS